MQRLMGKIWVQHLAMPTPGHVGIWYVVSQCAGSGTQGSLYTGLM